MIGIPRPLRERLTRLLGKGSYGRDTFVNTFGLLIVALVPIAALPILSRLYSPEDFGLFGVFTAAVGLGTIASTGRYEAAVMLPDDDQAAISVAAVAFVFVLAFTSLLAIAVTVAYASGVSLVRDHVALACLAVVAIAFSGCVQVLLNAAIRHRMFLKVNYARISGAIATTAIPIALGINHSSSINLAIGLTVGYIIISIVLFCLIIQNYNDISLPNKRNILEKARRYRNFPLFSLPSDFSNTLAANLPIIFFSSFFGAAVTGYLTMFQRAWAGTSIVANGLGETFRYRAATERQKTGKFNLTMMSTLLPLSILSILFFIILFGFGPKLFQIITGPEWRESGVYGQILAPLICLQFIASPVSWSFYISEKVKLLAVWQIILLISFLISFIIGVNTMNPKDTLMVYSAVGAVLYMIYIIISVRVSK